MNAITSYTAGFSSMLKSIRMIVLIYLSYLIIALLLAIPFYGLFRSAAGNSLLPDTLMNGFDATAIRELLAGSGKLFGFYLKAFLPWMLAFLLFQVYLTGGILSWVSNPRDKFSIAGFHTHGRRFFWRYLKLMTYFLVIHLVVFLILYLPYILITGSQEGLTDEQIMRPLFFLVILHIVLLIFLFLWADLVKSRIFNQDTTTVFKMIFRCLKMAVKRFFSFYFLAILLLAAPIVLFAGFYLVRSAIGVNTSLLILLVFILQQVLVLARTGCRVWRLGSVYNFYLGIS